MTALSRRQQLFLHFHIDGMRQDMMISAKRRQIMGIMPLAKREDLSMMKVFSGFVAVWDGAFIAVFFNNDLASTDRDVPGVRFR